MTAELAIPSYFELGNTLRELAKLKDDWNGTGAPAPSAVAFVTVSRLLVAFQKASIQVRGLFPDTDGGIIIRMVSHTPEVDASFECGNDGSVYIALLDYVSGKFTLEKI